MTDLIKTELGSLTTTGIGHPRQGQAGAHTGSITVIGSGSVSATVLIRGSNDGQAWTTLATISASGTGTATASAKWTDDYAMLRQEATALTGSVVSAQVVTDQTGGGASPASGGGAVVGGVINVNSANSAVLRAILQNAGKGISRGRIWCFGTSVTAGAGATNASLYAANGKAFSTPMQLAKLLSGAGFKAAADYTFGGQGTANIAETLAFDTRVTISGAVDQVGDSIGGKFFSLGGVGQSLTFTPGGTFNRVEMAWALNTGSGSSATLASNSGAATPSSASGNAGAAAMAAQTFVVPDNSTSLTVTYSGSSLFLPKWIGTRTEGSPTVEVLNGGWGGSRITGGNAAINWLANATGLNWGALGAQQSLDTSVPNVFFLDAVINDAAGAPGVSTYQAAMAQWIALLQPKGEVYVRIPSTVADSTEGQAFNIPRAVYNAYADAAIAAALAAGVGVIDHRYRNPDWAVSNLRGFFRDGYHPTALGYNDEAQHLRDLCVYVASL